MKIVIAASLFPPEVGETARWSKRRAHELSSENEVVVVAYARLPEMTPRVHVVAIDKRAALPLRIVRFTISLWRATRDAERIETREVVAGIPALVVAYMRGIPLWVYFRGSEADERSAREHPVKIRIIGLLERLLRGAGHTIVDEPVQLRNVRRTTVPLVPLVRTAAARSLAELGFVPDEFQPHLGGERAYFSADKSVLFGIRERDGARVVIKIASNSRGRAELERERACRAALERIGFAYGTFHSPEELYAGMHEDTMIVVTRFIEQDRPFLERSLEEQYSLALAGLEAQEGAHAVTSRHLRFARAYFDVWHVDAYLARARQYRDTIAERMGVDDSRITRAVTVLEHAHYDIERYCGFLTHYDYTPQNIRVSEGQLYLLDHASLRFGNKHESWARWMNFMSLYHPELEHMLKRHVQTERAPEEYRSLTAMRLFRLLELINHHVRIANESTDELAELSRVRVAFWEDLLGCVLEDIDLAPERIAAYVRQRDELRSPEEKARQHGLH